MSKRFTDTQKWQKSWFMDLPLKWKLAWCWAIDNCDHAGILSSNARLMSFMIGEPIDADEFLKTMQGRIVKLPNGRLFIPSFISFQYGPLYPSNPAHKGVIRIMEREGLMDEIDVRSSEEGSHRTRIGKTTRFKILVRDGMRCHYCEQIGTFDNLVVDHIIPTSKGGNNDDENLICACVSCNSEKQDRDYTEFITQKRDKLSLKSPFKILNGAKDMDKDKDKDKSARAIYDAYPRHIGLKLALKAITAVLKTVDAATLLSAAEAYSAATAKWDAKDRQFIPHPATWFNQGRYEDDPAEWIKSSTTNRIGTVTEEDHNHGF